MRAPSLSAASEAVGTAPLWRRGRRRHHGRLWPPPVRLRGEPDATIADGAVAAPASALAVPLVPEAWRHQTRHRVRRDDLVPVTGRLDAIVMVGGIGGGRWGGRSLLLRQPPPMPPPRALAPATSSSSSSFFSTLTRVVEAERLATGGSTEEALGARVGQRRRPLAPAFAASNPHGVAPDSTSIRSDDAGPILTTLQDVEAYVDRVERHSHGVLTSRDDVRYAMHVARSAFRGVGTGTGNANANATPERAALLGERLLLSFLAQKRRQIQQTQTMKQQQQPQTPHRSPDVRVSSDTMLLYPPVDLFNLVIMGWGDTKSKIGAERAQQIFDVLERLREEEEEEDDDDDNTTERTVNGGTDDAAAAWIRPPRPDRRTYKSLIRAWAVSKSATGPTNARHWLTVMEHQSGITDLLATNNMEASPATSSLRHPPQLHPPDRAMYNVVLSGYANAPLTNSTHHAPKATPLQEMTNLVEHMDRLYDLTQSDEYQLDAFSYQALLLAYSRQIRATKGPVDPTMVRDIEQLLTRMVRSLEAEASENATKSTTRLNATPNRRHGSGRGDDKKAAANVVPWPWAVGVLVEALMKSKNQPNDVRRAADYLHVLAGRAAPRPGMVVGPPPPPSSHGPRQRLEPRNANHRLAALAEDYPSQDSIWKVIQALERLDSEPSPTDADRGSLRDAIDELVRLAMEAPFERIFFVNQAAEFWSQTGWRYAPDLIEQLMGTAWERSRRIRSASALKPTGQTFAIAMRAWLRCEERDDAPHRCELLLQQMLQLYQETSDRYYRPRDEHLRSVLTCWLHRCRSGKRYQGLAGHLYPAEHIEAHLHWHVMPRSSPTTADADDETHDWIKNAAGHYSMAIRAWSQQVVDEKEDWDRVDRAVQLLDDLERLVSIIPAFPCNWALEVFAQPQKALDKRKKSYDAAIDTFRRGERNARTFVLLLQVLKTQAPVMDQDHRDVIEGLVKESCSSGMLTQDLIWHVVQLLDAESLQRLFGLTYQYATFVVQMRNKELNGKQMEWNGAPPSALLLRNLPAEWSCNIDRQRRSK